MSGSFKPVTPWESNSGTVLRQRPKYQNKSGAASALQCRRGDGQACARAGGHQPKNSKKAEKMRAASSPVLDWKAVGKLYP